VPDTPPKAPQPLAWDALDLPRIEPKPKTVIQDDEFALAIRLSERQQRDYVAIVGLIKVGGDLEPYYRRSETADRLLKTRQVLHLHLGGPASDAILYAIQYPEHVLLVRVDSHIHLDDLPPGKRLPVRGRSAFQDTLKAEAAVRAAELTASRARLAAAKARLLGPKKPKP
jgi:hypothetical protein